MKIILFILIFLTVFCSLKAEEPTIKFYFSDGSFKSYKIDDIDSIGMLKTGSVSILSVYKKIKSTSWNYELNLLEQIKFENRTRIIFIMSDTTFFENLIDIDSIIFRVIPPPKITSINPVKTKIGDNIIIKGTGFKQAQVASFVKFNSLIADEYVSWSATQIVVRVPAETVSGKLTVTVDGQISNEYDYEIIPFITNVMPAQGISGDVITITGTGFRTNQDTNTVSINGAPINSITSWKTTQIKFAVPDNASSGKLALTIGGNVSNSVNFSVLPNITNINPKAAYIGDAITITGSGFGLTRGSSDVSFNGKNATEFTSWEVSKIICQVPSGATSGKLSVTVSGKNSNELDFSVIPNIISIIPSSGLTGSEITITGTGFGIVQGTSSVLLNGLIFTDYTSWSSTKIKAKIPANAVSGKLSVKVDSYKSNEVDFTVIPNIVNISPNAGFIGDEITITGSGFGNSSGTGFVTFNNRDANEFTKWTPNEIIAKIPLEAKSGKLYVTASSIRSNEMNVLVYPNISDTIRIGTQLWMSKNLDVLTYRNGDTIPQLTDSTAWANATTGAWCYYNNNPSHGTIYGRLYNWYAVNDSRGLTPLGWHVPTDAEWTTLTVFLGSVFVAGGKMKEVGTSHWQSPNTGATNESGFTALPGGYRTLAAFMNINTYSIWWTSSSNGASSAYFRYLYYDNDDIMKSSYNKGYGFSIRCVKD